MFGKIFGFELRFHLRSPLIYISCLFFFLLTFGAISSDAVQIGGAIGNVNRNAPFVVMQLLTVLSLFGIFTTTAFVGNAAYRDFELKTDALFYSSPIRKVPFLLGRFAGSFVMSMLVFVAAALAIVIGSHMPWVDSATVGPLMPQAYLFTLGFMVLPNLLLVAAIFFCVASLTRNILATYASTVVFFIGYLASRRFIGDIDNDRMAALVDPFGLNSLSLATRYWTPFDRNTRILWPPDGPFLWNRILWTGIALAIIVGTVVFFRFATPARSSKAKRAEAEAPSRASLALPKVQQVFTRGSWFQQFRSVLGVELTMVMKGLPFIIITILAVANTIFAAIASSRIYGTSVYPVTHLMVSAINGGFAFFALILMTFYAGEMVWRERQLKLSDVIDASPVSTSALWSAKFSTLVVMEVILLAAATLATMIVQTAKGYHTYELGLYARGVFVNTGLTILLLAVLAFVVQVLTSNKNAGFLAIVLYLVLSAVVPGMHFEHRLYRLFDVPDITYSDMNGYGHFVKPEAWLLVYWYLFAGVLLVATHLLWVRGTETGLRARVRSAPARFGRGSATVLAILAAGFIGSGSYIFYNTNVINHYRPSDERDQRRAEFEKLYKKYNGLAQPRVTDVQADVAIDPEHRAVTVHGTYKLVNKTAVPIPELHVLMNPDAKSKISLPGATIKQADASHGYTIYHLAQPLAPGASLTMTFDTSQDNRGFVTDGQNNSLVANGTFFNNGELFPSLGYQAAGQLQDRSKRKKYGLPPVERMKPASDLAARQNTYISTDADWINLDTTVSTTADQTAIAPGYLQKEWTANGRHYFRYKTTSPILPFWAYLSAHYQVKRDSWKGIPIEIYYDAKHPYNVDRMIYAVKKSLDYYTANFSPYQHAQVRILEFPRYASFAQSFPNTIPYSESIGFIADLRDREAIDYVFYVTAHEVAHQWWAHQVIGGNVQGSTMLSETLSQYSALMVMQKEYGKAQMRKFLKWELDRYLNGRGGELVAEMPLVKVENQDYIHYRKGSLVMYALQDYIGEDKVNAALRTFIAEHAFSQPPYPTAEQLVAEFRKVTPPEQQSIITDLFETITLYDNKTLDATSTKLADGRYKVTFTVSATKLRGTGAGAEKPIAIDDWIDVGVLGDGGQSKTHDDKVLFMEKRRITQPKQTFDIVVSGKPTRAGIDPFNKLIDRNPVDNTKKL